MAGVSSAKWRTCTRCAPISHRSSSEVIHRRSSKRDRSSGSGVAAQRLLAAQVEVRFEVRQRQLPQRAEDRLAKTQAGIVRAGDGAPMAMPLEDGHDVIVVAYGFEVHDQRPVSLEPQRRGGEQRAVEALHGPLPQHAARRPARGAGHVVVDVVEELLNTPLGREPAQERRFAWGEAERRHAGCVSENQRFGRSGPAIRFISSSGGHAFLVGACSDR